MFSKLPGQLPDGNFPSNNPKFVNTQINPAWKYDQAVARDEAKLLRQLNLDSIMQDAAAHERAISPSSHPDVQRPINMAPSQAVNARPAKFANPFYKVAGKMAMRAVPYVGGMLLVNDAMAMGQAIDNYYRNNMVAEQTPEFLQNLQLAP